MKRFHLRLIKTTHDDPLGVSLKCFSNNYIRSISEEDPRHKQYENMLQMSDNVISGCSIYNHWYMYVRRVPDQICIPIIYEYNDLDYKFYEPCLPSDIGAIYVFPPNNWREIEAVRAFIRELY